MASNANTPAARDDSPLARWHGTRPFAYLHQEIDRLFEDFTRGFHFGEPFAKLPSVGLTPRMDMVENKEAIVFTAELPGLEEKDVEVNLADNVLTIRGEKKAEQEGKEHDYQFSERSYGAFLRRVELPARVDPQGVKAQLSNGVLTITVPKPTPAVTRKIEVKSA